MSPRSVVFAAACMSLFGGQAFAQWEKDISVTSSFESPPAAGGQYYDTMSAASDHQLQNNEGQPIVDFAGSETELGFTTWFYATEYSMAEPESRGLTDGDWFGVTNFTGSGVGSYPDGTQGFQMSDTDGITQLRMAEISGFSTVSFELWFSDTNYETGSPQDAFSVGFGLAGIDTTNLLDSAGADLDDWFATEGIIEGQWASFTFDLNDLGITSGSLQFTFESNASSEQVFIDNIVFQRQSAGVVPGIGGLAFLAGAAGVRRRRR